MVEYGGTLRFQDFGFTTDTGLPINVWTRVGTQFTVPAGLKYVIGRKFDGYACAILKDTIGTICYGMVRIVASDPQEYRKTTVLEFHTSTTTDMGDKAKKKLVPYTTPRVRKDSKLILYIKPDAAMALDKDFIQSAIDVTVEVV